ncbi:MAG: DUF5680 domain-containing protein [Patescibacteria group bacterium]|nr:DUF5680 domain-containing protein [Patescibacteria group bacterium]MCL5431996.1 DUF5680 domain-containing protein [Patescibacteria group bacterium]
MNYKGTIIEESLDNADVLKGLKILKTDIESVTDEHQTPWLKQWTLHRVEIPEIDAAEIAQKLSKVIDVSHVSSWYADFRNDKKHYIIFREKVFHVDRSNKTQYDEVRKYGLTLGIPEYQLPNYQDLPKDVLAHFLSEANKSTYANKDAPKVESNRLKSEDYHFEKDGLIYHDTYFGSRDFIGEEIVYQEEKPVWGANYYGFILSEEIGEKEVYDFLRESLMQEYDSPVPVRGPNEFTDGDWKYKFFADGDLARFSGAEEISLKDKVIYRCFVHGGFIQ